MPPASMPPNTPRMELSRKYESSRPMPRDTTVQVSDSSGIIASTKAPMISTRIVRSVRRRRRSVAWSASRSDAPAGVGAVGVGVVVMSVRPREVLAPRDDRAGGHVHGQGDDEQGQAGGDQRRDAGLVRLRELRRDVGGDRLLLAGGEQLERVEEPGRQDHQDGHRLAERAAQAE